MLRRTIAAAALVTSLASLPQPAAAHDLTPDKTKINSLAAVPGAGSVEVAGSATFGGQKLLSLATDPAGDSTGGIREVDLVEAKMAQLDPATGDLNFVFKLADLPPAGGIPEGVRYEWMFQLLPIERFFRIETSFTDVYWGGTTIPWAGLWSCAPPPGGCNPAGNVTAEYVGSDNEIFVDIPKTTLENAVGRDLAGLRLATASEEWGRLRTSLRASFIWAQTDELSPNEYLIAYPKVDIGIAAPNGAPASTVPADVAPEGDFAASLDSTGLAPGPYDVVATACYGTNCGTYRQRITI